MSQNRTGKWGFFKTAPGPETTGVLKSQFGTSYKGEGCGEMFP